MRGRGIAIAALAVPTLAGLGYLASFGAPAAYVAINGTALATACAWIVLAPRHLQFVMRRLLIAAALAALFAPLLTGPAVSGVARWLPLGPFTLHAGMLLIPALVVLASEEPDWAPAILGIALAAIPLQPDMASGAALMLAAVGLHEATRDWRYGLFAIVAFVAAIGAAMSGELPAQPFVERVHVALAFTHPAVALALLVVLVASFFLILHAPEGSEPARKALAGSLFGFAFAGIVSNYPSPMVGYGAAPILGFGLALGMLSATARIARPKEPARD